MIESGLDSLSKTHNISVSFRAYELRPPDAPPLDEAYARRISEHWPNVQRIAQERFHVDMRTHPKSQPGASRLAHIGGKFALENGRDAEYHRAVFRAIWQDGKAIDSVEVLAEIIGGLGLDQAVFRMALADQTYLDEVLTDEYFAHASNLNGVPALIFGKKYLVSGAQPVEVLREVVDQCIAEGLVEG
jgi:predicted DsbA family dithiol-disulfide isomerase